MLRRCSTMGLFSQSDIDQINKIAAKSIEITKPTSSTNSRSVTSELQKMEDTVSEYFKDSEAILITSAKQLHDYVDACIAYGYAGIDTETTGLDRINDYIVGFSLYVPGQFECYIPIKHRVPIFEILYPNQLTYEECAKELQRLVDNNVKLILANADFDLAMIFKDMKVDLIPAFFFDVISAWRCLKENELDNSLKGLYAKYPAKGKVDPKKFSDFFSPKLFPYCKPEIAKLYAAHDAKITFVVYEWELPYLTKTHDKCKKNHLEKIADLWWNIEVPCVRVCAILHRNGIYFDSMISPVLHKRYTDKLDADKAALAVLIQDLIDNSNAIADRSRPFKTGKDFNPNSTIHVTYLIKKILGRTDVDSTGKDELAAINHPATDAILKVRGDIKLLTTYVDKLPNSTGPDGRIHPSFKSMGAATGRMCIAEGVLVLTKYGPVPIEKIKVGDEVYCYNDTLDIQLNAVLNTWQTGKDRQCLIVKWKGFKSGGYITCTPEHKIFTVDKGWIPASELSEHDKIISYSGASLSSFVEVESIEEDIHLHNVYDIEVEGCHNFIANCVCVHNSSADPNAQNIPSKAHDIRHLFRATPELIESVDIADKVKLFVIDSLNVDGVGWTKVRDLTLGQCVVTNSSQSLRIESISDPDDLNNVVIKLSISLIRFKHVKKGKFEAVKI